ncbi:phage protein [Bifidobacterium longum subsp. longum]|uniref:Panacea domain-containing protein n=1 Tax=Bifidobacterium longum TaxID=216816 RepID=UPI00103FD28E|nr:type II toxin-antitoxin system antitoxin SocA domain-containing protein [Bifidobacterium longum]TCF21125.1 phage protein [Bifidobacterium longum subsp. longum]
MTSIFDVAAYVLDKLGVMTTMKLEKLCYYSQAWANGPVCPDLYHAHKGMFKITRGDIHGDPSNIDEDGTSTIDAVLNAYGKMGAYQLSELTHSERPWRDARGDLPQGAICNTEITEAAMAEYYGSLTD